MDTDYKRNRHSCYSLNYHLVVFTKYRCKCISKEIMESLVDICTNNFEKWDCITLEFNGYDDNLHIIFEAPPQVQLSKLINNFKTVSSRLIRRDFSDYLDTFYSKPVFWSDSYLILSTGGDSSEIIRQYTKNEVSLKNEEIN